MGIAKWINFGKQKLMFYYENPGEDIPTIALFPHQVKEIIKATVKKNENAKIDYVVPCHGCGSNSWKIDITDTGSVRGECTQCRYIAFFPPL